MTDPIDLTGTIVAVFDDESAADRARAEIGASGYDVDDIRRTESLDPEENDGLFGTIRKAARALGDENRLRGRLSDYIDEGSNVLVVHLDSGEDARDGGSVAASLKKHGAHYLWRFNEWTYVPLSEPAP